MSIDRRDFLIGALKTMAAGLIGLMPYRQERVVYGQTYPLAVAVQGINDDPVDQILKTALDGVGGIERFICPGMKVVIKPNATWAYPPHTASSTDPELLRALIRAAKEAGAGKITVLDHCSIEPGTSEAIRINGIGKLVKEEDVEGIFPDRNNAPAKTYTTIELPDGKAYTKLGVIKAAVDADVRINLAVAKSHNVTKITLCLKHMMGFLQAPGRLHASLEQGIADLSTPSPIQAQLHILEALRVRLPVGNYRVCAGPETDLTNPRVVSRKNQIILGSDPVLIDSYACTTFFEMAAEELPYLIKAAEAAVGMTDFQKAIEDGVFSLLRTGELPVTIVPQVEATAAAGSSPIVLTSATPLKPSPLLTDSTSTPLPTIPPQSDNQAAVGIAANSANSCGQVSDPSASLNAALIPTAIILTGVGMVAGARSRRSASKPPSANENEVR